MKGCYNPADPIFGFDSDDVKVKRDTKTGMVETLHKELQQWRELFWKANNELNELRGLQPCRLVASNAPENPL